MKKLVYQIALVMVAAFVLKWGWEGSMNEDFDRLKLGGGGAQLSLELRSKLSQNLAIALLSGFRGIVADFVWLAAHGAWENQVWYKMREGIELAVILQPHSISFWDIGAWHFAWNASYGEFSNPKYTNKAHRLKVQRDWIMAGRKFLHEGIRNNPGHYELHFKLGWLIYQKLEDPLNAVPHLQKAAGFPDAPLYVTRMVGHMYQKGGKTRDAYEWWKQLWLEDHSKYPQQLWYKIEQWGRECEEKLNIPDAERIFPSRKKSVNVKGKK
ncbi:MAG: hypothetical protein HY360_13285 [Verrucomicrobia bacterium]|nr:hypothetical protein [Verrucomicrobiota bacterium]